MTTQQAEIIAEAGSEIEPIDEDAIRAEVATLDIGGYGETDDERTLARYVRRLAQLADERQRVKDWHDKRLKAIESQERGIEYVMGGIVRDITKRMLAGGKKKSVSTPWGTAGFRTVKAALVVNEPEKIIAAEADHPDWVRTKKEVAKAALNDYFAATGDIPDGCEVTPEAEKFFTK